LNTVAPVLTQEFSYANVMQVPKITRITLNIGEGEARENARVLEGIQQDLTTIAGQKPVVTKARKSIAQFKIRDGNNIGVKVTLRGSRMWDFLDRLMNVALPRTRDFRGVSRNAFDGRGDYSLGIREQTIFPEIDYNRIDKIRGMQVNIVTSARTDDEGRRLLELMGMPFVREAE
jgi:large subunit ribosomal protein L5